MVDFNYSLESVDISSVTINYAVINTIFAVIVAIIILILGGVGGGATGALGVLTIVPSIVFCTLIIAVFNSFIGAYLYNGLSKKLGTVKISLFENKEIKKISVKETSLNYTVITTILNIIYILIAMLFLPLLFSLVYQVLMLAGNMTVAYLVYNIVMLFTDPVFIIAFIVLSAVIQVILCLISTYSYNLLTDKVFGVLVKLTKEDNDIVIDNVSPTNTALILGIIGLIFGVIEGIISFVGVNSLYGLVGSILGGFIGTFVMVFISCYLYNILSGKLGKIRIKLDEI